MSIFSGIASAAHTFVSWFEKQVARTNPPEAAVKKAALTLQQIADAAFKYASVVIGIVAAEIPAGSEADNILNEILSDLHVASAVVFDVGAHPNVAGLIKTVADNLGLLLTAGHISNTNSVSAVTKVINTLLALVAAFAPVV